MNNDPILALADWRRRVSDMYSRVRAMDDTKLGWRTWRDSRNDLFRQHPQSPIDAVIRQNYADIPLFDYDPAFRFLVALEPLAGAVEQNWDIGIGGPLRLTPGLRTKGLREALGGELTMFQIQGYGGGLFLPFKDATSGAETYGGGRYLIDAIKGADLGMAGDRVVLDFNFSYHPSCRHSDAWICPLAPLENVLPTAICAGERMTSGC